MEMRSLAYRKLALLGLFTAILGGCSDSGSDGNVAVAAPADAPPVHQEPERLPIPEPTGEGEIGARIYEYHIDLTHDTIPAGVTRFHVLNAGTTSHIFIVRNDDSFNSTQHIVPGDSAVLEADLPPGEYHIVCGVRDEFDHISEGERTTLIVQ